MEKIKVTNDIELANAIKYFGEENDLVIRQIVGNHPYPYVLVGSYSDDIEFGEGYDFVVVLKTDL
jgi:hypothetical protein